MSTRSRTRTAKTAASAPTVEVFLAKLPRERAVELEARPWQGVHPLPAR